MRQILNHEVRDHLPVYIGYELTKLRREKGMSGAELGRLIGVSQQQMSRYERGVCQITTTTLCLLLYCLDSSLVVFFQRVAKMLTEREPSLYDEMAPIFRGPEFPTAQNIDEEIYARFNTHVSS